MGKASSAKKVARAARVGESRRPGERRLIGFPAAVVLTVVLGVVLVAFAAGTRDAAPSPTLQDHWHSAYAIWDCQTGAFEPPLPALTDAQGNNFDPEGIHSHDDGLIHIHPFTSNVTGNGANMSVFFEALGVEFTDTTLTAAGRVYDEAEITCDGEPVEIQILRWNQAATAADNEPDEIITENFGDVRYENDGEAFTIAIAPLGADIPPPETISRLLTVNPTLVEPGLVPIDGVDVGDAETNTGDGLTDDVEPDDNAETDDAEADDAGTGGAETIGEGE